MSGPTASSGGAGGDTNAEGDPFGNADAWVDGLFTYRWRHGLRIHSDPRGVLAKGTGTGMWSAGEVLADYLAEQPELYRGKSILELGAGLGTVGLTLASCGAGLCVLTDMERQVPLLRRNAEANFPPPLTAPATSSAAAAGAAGVDKAASSATGAAGGADAIAAPAARVHVCQLDWRSAADRESLAPWRGAWSFIVGSDVGYDPDLFEALLQTLLAQCSPTTLVYLALADRVDEPDEPDAEAFASFASTHFDVQEVHARCLEVGQSVTKVLLFTPRNASSAALGPHET